MSLTVRPIPAEATRQLRHELLRPFAAPATLVYPGDDHPLALHVGAFAEGALVGIASMTPEVCPALAAPAAWRLRGMATSAQVRRRGYGAALIFACLAHSAEHGSSVLWCHGRTSALPFYRALGFVALGAEFVVPDTGPHYLLWRAVAEMKIGNRT